MSPEARERSFDELAVGLFSGSISRGKAIKLMGAALLGGTLASVGIREAAAVPPVCKRNGESCRRDQDCCSGACACNHRCVGASSVENCAECHCGQRVGPSPISGCTDVTLHCLEVNPCSVSLQCEQFCRQRNEAHCGTTHFHCPEGCPRPA